MDADVRKELDDIKGMLAEVLMRLKGLLDPSVNQPQLPIAHDPNAGLVRTPRGRWFPKPAPESGEMFMGYTLRVGEHLGDDKARDARNRAGALFIAATPLIQRHNGDWVAACEEWLYGNPDYRPDPAWSSYRPGR